MMRSVEKRGVRIVLLMLSMINYSVYGTRGDNTQLYQEKPQSPNSDTSECTITLPPPQDSDSDSDSDSDNEHKLLASIPVPQSLIALSSNKIEEKICVLQKEIVMLEIDESLSRAQNLAYDVPSDDDDAKQMIMRLGILVIEDKVYKLNRSKTIPINSPQRPQVIGSPRFITHTSFTNQPQVNSNNTNRVNTRSKSYTNLPMVGTVINGPQNMSRLCSPPTSSTNLLVDNTNNTNRVEEESTSFTSLPMVETVKSTKVGSTVKEEEETLPQSQLKDKKGIITLKNGVYFLIFLIGIQTVVTLYLYGHGMIKSPKVTPIPKIKGKNTMRQAQ